jgi:hypothetical protein
MQTHHRTPIPLRISSLCEPFHLRSLDIVDISLTGMCNLRAYPYGTPTVLSSYSGFTDTDAGAPNGGLHYS